MIGVGGMGEVWLAMRGDSLHAGRAAVKLLRVAHAASAGAELLNARFAREGELLARLTHPHIAQLLDAGVTAEGTRYLVLEYVQGERIDHWCDARRLGLAARLRLLQQLCDAVAFAHANLIVHRDLKPANVLVTETGQVKLLDFGVAKLLADVPDAGADELTRLGAAGLTPEYAAPEQISGAAVTVATDVYALGVLMYVLLSGRRPYGSPHATAAQLARDIVEADPRPLGAEGERSDAGAGARGDANPAAPEQADTQAQAQAHARSTSPQRLRQQLRGDLAHIVAKALRKRPADRYASVQAFADDIGRHLRHEAVSAQAPTLAYRSRKFVQRHKVLVAAGTLVLVTVAAGVAATLWQAQRAREQAALARAEAANAVAIKDFMLGVFGTASVGDGKTTQDTTARELLQRGGERLLADHQLAPAVRLELLTEVASLQNNLGLVDSADPMQREALRLARDVYGPTSEKYVYALVERGLSLTPLGRPQESDQLTREAVAIMEANGLRGVESYPVALYQLGFNAMQAGALTAAVGYLTRAAASFEADQPRHAMRAIAQRWLGNALAAMDDFGGAEAQLRRSIELSGGQDKLRDFGVGLGHYALGDLFIRAGRFEAARVELEQALVIMESTLGPRHRGLSLVRGLLGRAKHQLGQREAGHALLASALDIARDDASRQLGNTLDRATLLLAAMALDDGDAPEALSRARAAAQRWQPRGGAPWALALVALAEAETMSGQADAAVTNLRLALPLIDAELGAGSLAARQARVALGEANEQRAHASDDAQLAYATALAPAAGNAPADSPTRTWLRARATLGQARLALATDPAGAAALARQATTGIRPQTPVLREQLLLAQARLTEGRALEASGQVGDGRRLVSQASRTLDALQVSHSPRAAQARRTLAALAP